MMRPTYEARLDRCSLSPHSFFVKRSRFVEMDVALLLAAAMFGFNIGGLLMKPTVELNIEVAHFRAIGGSILFPVSFS
jgi:hypothetical protein